MDRNTVIGFVLLALLFFGYFYYSKQGQLTAEKQKQQAEDKKRQAAQDKAKQEALEKASAKASDARRQETLRRLQGLAGASGG